MAETRIGSVLLTAPFVSISVDNMTRIRTSFSSGIVALALALLWAVTLPAQNAHSVNITPEKVTLLIGESKTFRLIDQNGHMQRHVSWSISDSDAFQTEGNDEWIIKIGR